MKVLLILSACKVHRAENLETYRALKQHIPDLVWCSGTSFDIDNTLAKGQLWLNVVNEDNLDERPKATKFAPEAFPIAIIDQSLDLTQDQSPSFFGGGIANRSLDSQDYDRPSEIADRLTMLGTVCIGTSRNGVCLDELAGFGGAVMTSALENLVGNLAQLMPEAERLARENCFDPTAGLKALTLRQPFAWSVFHAGKDIENRKWPAKVRGIIAIHAADEQPTGAYEGSKKFIRSVLGKLGVKGLRIPAYERLPRGAIIGVVDIVDCVVQSQSAWFEGPIGYRLANARLLPKPIPCQGERRFFTLPRAVERQVRQALAQR